MVMNTETQKLISFVKKYFALSNLQKIGCFIKKIFTLFNFAIGLGALLFIVVIIVIVTPFDRIADTVKYILGTEENKKEIITFLAYGIIGCITVIGALAVNRRANAVVENNKLVEKGHIQERFKSAAEHLGNERTGTRIAAFYEFYHLAKDNKEMRESIFNILCAHIRQTTTDENYNKDNVGDKERPTEEIQTLLDVLFEHKYKYKYKDHVFSGWIPNLQRARLKGAMLPYANLERVDLLDANLEGAQLWHANLKGAFLLGVNLEGAQLNRANLEEAELEYANLVRANLSGANLSGAELRYANLERADLFGANLKEAVLFYTNLQRVDLSSVKNIERAFLSNAKISDEIKFPDGYNVITRKDNEGRMYIVRIEKDSIK